MIVEIWSLKRGPQNPPRPLEPEHSAWVEVRWREWDGVEPTQPVIPAREVREEEILDRVDDYGTYDLVFL